MKPMRMRMGMGSRIIDSWSGKAWCGGDDQGPMDRRWARRGITLLTDFVVFAVGLWRLKYLNFENIARIEKLLGLIVENVFCRSGQKHPC